MYVSQTTSTVFELSRYLRICARNTRCTSVLASTATASKDFGAYFASSSATHKIHLTFYQVLTSQNGIVIGYMDDFRAGKRFPCRPLYAASQYKKVLKTVRYHFSTWRPVQLVSFSAFEPGHLKRKIKFFSIGS